MPDLSTITPVTREEEFLDRIARAAASPNLPEVDASDNGDVLTVVSGEWAAAAPASCLPEVTSSNNGQVLTVVSGEWAPASPAGGGGLKVTLTVTDTAENTIYTIDKNYTELTAAINAGTVPIIIDSNGNIFYIAAAEEDDPDFFVTIFRVTTILGEIEKHVLESASATGVLTATEPK